MKRRGLVGPSFSPLGSSASSVMPVPSQVRRPACTAGGVDYAYPGLIWITRKGEFFNQAGTRRRASGCLAPVGIAAGGSVSGRKQSIW
jgi:hypothetical protein